MKNKIKNIKFRVISEAEEWLTEIKKKINKRGCVVLNPCHMSTQLN